MNDRTLLSQLSLPQNALVFDLAALYACLQTIPDHRDPRGRQYPLALDGKTLRGTIPLGETRGVHLLAAYLPEQGVVLAQMRV